MKNKIFISGKHLKALEVLITSLSKRAMAGDKNASVEKAWAIAIYKFIKSGNQLTDLSWFKYTRFYTGKKDINKAA